MFKTIVNAFKIPDLRRKMLFVLMIILLYRLGAVMPVPFVDANVLAENFSASNGSFFQYLNIMSGEAFSRATLFALSIQPYITAQIVMQLLTIAIPALEKMQKEGEEGRKKINTITRYVTVGLGAYNGLRLLRLYESQRCNCFVYKYRFKRACSVCNCGVLRGWLGSCNVACREDQ